MERTEYYKIEIRIDVDSEHKIERVIAELISSAGELIGSYSDDSYTCSTDEKYRDVKELFTNLNLVPYVNDG